MSAALHLRPPAESDAVPLFDAIRESMADLQPWMSWCKPGITIDDTKSWIQDQARQRQQGSAFEFVSTLGGDIVGCCGLNQIQPGGHIANLGYWIRTSKSGQGLAVSCVHAVAEWAFANTELVRLEIVVAVDNKRSQRVAQKAGAVEEGVLRARLRIHERMHDAYMSSLLRPVRS